MPNYFVIDDYNAPSKAVTDVNGEPVKKKFSRSQLIIATPAIYTVDGNDTDVVETNDGYYIPNSNVFLYESQTKSEGDASTVGINEKIQDIASKDLIQDVMSVSYKSMTGLTIGVFGGFAYALVREKSLMWCGVIGGVGGGIAGYIFGKKMANNKKLL